MAPLYQGPIIDAHHHLWNLSLGRHPWLQNEDSAIAALGDIGYLRRNYLVDDYLADASGENLAGSVYIEAVWDRRRNPIEEAQWLESIPHPRNVGSRCIAYAPLRSPDVETILAYYGDHPLVVGVRETIRWHPDPAKRWTEAGLLQRPDWRRGFALLAKYGLVLELLMNAWQSGEVAVLAQEFPQQVFLINHCCTPNDRDPEGIKRWEEGLATMAAMPNIAIKVSNFGAYDPDKSIETLRRTVMTCIDAFGTRRAMFGTDYPVAKRHMSYASMCKAFRQIVNGFSPDEQRALFHDNAKRYYRFE